MAVEALESYLGGKWSRGDGAKIELVDPTNGSLLATVGASGVDLKAAVAFAREQGGPALRALTYAERARLLGAVADVLAANRAHYEEIAIANSGNTEIDAAIDAFVKEVAHEMTLKAGQKCTAIRRVLAPATRANAVADALAARLAKVAVGDPRSEVTRMGPLVTRTQQAAALDGISKLASEAELICGGPTAPKLDGIDSTKSAFVAPTLLKVESADKARAVHDTEVFGPAATIIPYRSENEAFALIARGGGSLVVSIFGDDREFLARAVSELGPTHGRVLAVDPSIADAHTGHGIVMPQCHHGGPGRAGNGAELGGLYGLRFYHQRVAVQGSTDLLDDLQVKAAALH
jgi:3,4-dehydroadipyl-CoA semialdehyde dehydrogenase